VQSIGRSNGRRNDTRETTGSLQLDQRVDGGLGSLCSHSLLELPELRTSQDSMSACKLKLEGCVPAGSELTTIWQISSGIRQIAFVQ
jgi:hypothetical protein